MIVTRYDNGGALEKPVELPNGYLRVEGFISRTGCQTYERDGAEIIEYRPPEEVFAVDTLASFEAVPLTNTHPAVPLNSRNTAAYQCGSVLNPRQDGTRTRATLLITDAKAIEALRSGRQELSCGYQCELDPSPGVAPDGTRYDYVQRRVQGNHVALVDAGRAGAECRVRLDSAGTLLAESVAITSSPSTTTQKASEVTVNEELKKMLEQLTAAQAKVDASDKALAALQAELSKAQARADMAEAEAKEAAPRAVAAVKARQELESKAKAAFPGVKVDGVSDAEIKRQVVESRGTLKVDSSKSEAYLDAAFDFAIALEPRQDSAPIAEVVEQDENDAVSKAQSAFSKRMDAFFKPSAV